MDGKSTAIKLLKEIRKREEENFNKEVFCREHKFDLEAEKFKSISDELRRICSMIQDKFETGYISSDHKIT